MRKSLYTGLMAGMLGMGMAVGQEDPTVGFSGYVDADFASALQGSAPNTTGLEVDLTTTVTFNPKLNAVIYTTMNDGVVPAQGNNVWWPGVNFDGVALNWMYNDDLTIHVGDLIYGTGYFGYYLHKRSAVVVGEHAVRGAGFSYGDLTVSTGMDGAASWSTFAKYDIALGEGMTLTPSGKYTFVDGATPFVGGLSFDGEFGSVGLSADASFNYYDDVTDPGFTVLVEPSYSSGNFSVAGAVFYQEKGDAPSPNVPAQTLAGLLASPGFDDFFVYVEPGVSLNETFAFGLPLEYHDETSAADDESVWIVPTFYIYPGSTVEWWVWAQAVVPTAGGADPEYFAGSEIIFTF